MDTAYEAIDSLHIEEDTWGEPPPPFDGCFLFFYSNSIKIIYFADDLDDFEQQIPLTKTLFDIFCELIVDTNSSLVQESVVRSLLIAFGEQIEQYFDIKANKIVKNINGLIGKLPTNEHTETLPLKFEKMLELCVDSSPSKLNNCFPFFFIFVVLLQKL